MRYGYPAKILHDQGTEFENELFYHLERMSGIKKKHTTPYHPECNGKAERFNRTLLGMLRTLPKIGKSRWKDHLQRMVHAYNATTSRSTGYSPFFLMFGREPRLPIDLLFSEVTDEPKRKSYRQYVEEWQSGMKAAYQVASDISGKVANRNKVAYDRRSHAAVLEEGDRVLVRNLREKGGPGKLRSYWESIIYNVIERRGEGPVYVVEPENGGERRVLHRNHLLPVGSEFSVERIEDSMKDQDKLERNVDRSNNTGIKKEKRKVDQTQPARKGKKNEVQDASNRQEGRKNKTNVKFEEDQNSENDSEETESEEDVCRRVSKRVQKKTKRLNYGRMGSPGHINQVTQHMSAQHLKTKHPHQQNQTVKQSHQHSDNLKHEPSQQQQPQNSEHVHNCEHNTDTQHKLSTDAQHNKQNTDAHNSEHNTDTLHNEQNIHTHNSRNSTNVQYSEQNKSRDRCQYEAEFSFLCQMLEQQQVLISMLLSFFRDNGHCL